MPNLKYLCSRCGRQQERHHNAKRCIDQKCGGELVEDNVAAKAAIVKIQAIQAQVEVLIKERDRFREMLRDWNAILETWDDGLEEYTDTIQRQLEQMLEKLSGEI